MDFGLGLKLMMLLMLFILIRLVMFKSYFEIYNYIGTLKLLFIAWFAISFQNHDTCFTSRSQYDKNNVFKMLTDPQFYYWHFI